VATVTEGADEPVDEGALGFGGEADDAHDDDGAADAPAAATPDAADPLNQSTDIYASAPAYIPVRAAVPCPTKLERLAHHRLSFCPTS
jgi:hypothetical protein